MNPNRLRAVARRLAAAPRTREPTGAADAELLGRFLDRHDEEAFADLVARHLPAVRAACRCLLRDPNDADDATQATFLVLVRRAAAVRDRAALGGWLYRVAWRVANRLRRDNLRRAARTAGVNPDATPARSSPAAAATEALAAVHEEIGRLPEYYRLAVTACYAGGTPTAEAAKRLGWPKGTLLTRLAWARKRLRDRLGKRGVALAGGFTALLGNRAGSAGAAALAELTGRIAVGVATNDPAVRGLVSERVSSLTEGVVRTMAGTKLKAAAALVVVAAALLGAGLGRFTAGAADAAGPADKKLAAPAVATPAAEPQAKAPVANPGPEQDKNAAGPGPGDLVVRRPHGSYTKELAPFGRATLTFTDTRIHLHATIQIEKLSVTVTADADYSINRESMVYGVVNSAEVTGPFDLEEAAEVAWLAAAANDMPFAFRIRVDDDAIVVKDVRFGAIGSPAFMQVIGHASGSDEELELLTGLVGGKYRADPNPDRNPAPVPRGNPGQPLPRPKKNVSSVGAITGVPTIPN